MPELNRQAIHENKDTFNTIDWMFYWNTKGLCYEKLNMFDSAMTAFNQALYFTKRNQHPGWIGLVQGNLGQIFLHQGQLDSAEILLNMDIHASIRDSQQFADNAANSLQLLSRIYTMRGQPMEALRVLRRAQQFLYQLPSKSIQANLTFAFMLAFEKLGRADSVLAYSNRYTVLRDSIEHQAASNKEEFVNLRLENTLSIHKIESLHKERNRINLIRNFSIVLALLAGALSYLFLNRQRLKMKLHEQQTLEAKNKAEHEMMEAKSKLEFFTQHLIEKNNLVETLQHQLNQKTLDDQQLQVISMLSQHTILTDEDWDRFRHLFEKVYPGFFHNLKIKAPDITLAEQRMAALTKLHLSSKEASYLLGISHASVNKAKLRLRTRLALETDADLDAYLA